MEQHSYAKVPSFPQRHWLSLLAVTLLGALALWSANGLDLGWGRLTREIPEALRMFGEMMPPSMEYRGLVGQGLLESFHIALLGTVLAAIFALPAGLLAARNASKHPILYRTGRFILSALRTLPTLLLAIIIMPGVGAGPLCGVLAMSIHSVGILGKLYAETIESIDPSPIKALTSTGSSLSQALFDSVLPQLLPKFTAFVLSRLEANIRVATVLGLVGAGGIGQILMANITYRIWPNVGVVLLGIIFMVTAMERFSIWLRAKLA